MRQINLECVIILLRSPFCILHDFPCSCVWERILHQHGCPCWGGGGAICKCFLPVFNLLGSGKSGIRGQTRRCIISRLLQPIVQFPLGVAIISTPLQENATHKQSCTKQNLLHGWLVVNKKENKK